MEQPTPPTAPTPNLTAAAPGPLGVRDKQHLSSRVCDNCIWKKVKCDLQRPTCSRCVERGYTCKYTSIRRKPGPPRGSHRGSLSSARPQRSPGHQRSPTDSRVREDGDGQGVLPTPALRSESTARTTPTPGSTTVVGLGLPQDANRNTDRSSQLDLLPEEQSHLLRKFMEVIHDAVPIFSKARFPACLDSSLDSGDLMSTLLIITAKLTDFAFSSKTFDLEARIDLMLSSGSLQEDMFGDSPSLNLFRKTCLLAFYEFHQFPGHQAWMRIGKLTRMAYWIGLDRLEASRALNLDFDVMSEDDLEDWRLVWWCVYRFDSYANVAAGTPYLIDETLVGTALVRDEQVPPKRKIHLPSQPDRLWELVPEITSDSQPTALFNLHIITATAMRQVGRALRLRMIRRRGECLIELERCISSLRLALPTNHNNPTRNAFGNETSSDHHARLVTVLHLYMARLLISLFSCATTEEGDEWLLNWQRVLEVCQDISSISEQWNSTFSLAVDPAICFIIFTALIFIDLHKKCATSAASDMRSNLEHCETVLLLHLEQFSSTWTLPQLLILSFKTFRELLVGPLLYHHIRYILSRFEAPLHPRWLQFLKTAPDVMRFASPA